ncbi:MAG: DMT family transporter [Limnochordaceae bacterium]|nr:DMT family transporter [Limnochordaceae bacterium]
MTQTAPVEPGAHRSRRLADGTLLFITLVWGVTFVAVKDAVSRVPVFSFLTLRFALAAVTLALWLAVKGWKSRRRGAEPAGGSGGSPGGPPASWAGLLTGGLLFLGYAFQTLGLQYTSPGKAGFITGLSVVLVPILEAWVFRRPQERAALVGVALAAAGMAVMSLEPADLAVHRGDLLVLMCAVAFGGHVTAVAHLGRRSESVSFTLWQVLAVVALSAVVASFERWDGRGVDAAVAGTLLVTGPLVSGVLLLAQVWGQRRTSATHAAVIFAMEPVFAALGGWALAGERLGVRGLVGGVLILAGMLAAELGRHGTRPLPLESSASRPA